MYVRYLSQQGERIRDQTYMERRSLLAFDNVGKETRHASSWVFSEYQQELSSLARDHSM
jgi:hypothetical protein